MMMMACDSFIHICDSVWVSLHTIDTANDYELCARSGVIPDPATFRPLLKKVCNNPSWHKAIFFVASHLHPPYTRKWHAPALQRIKGHIIGARRTTGKKLTGRTSVLHRHIDNNNSSNTHVSSDLFSFSSTIAREKD